MRVGGPVHALNIVWMIINQSAGTGLPLLEAGFHFLFCMFTYYGFFFLQEACIISVQKKLNEGSEIYLKDD